MLRGSRVRLTRIESLVSLNEHRLATTDRIISRQGAGYERVNGRWRSWLKRPRVNTFIVARRARKTCVKSPDSPLRSRYPRIRHA